MRTPTCLTRWLRGCVMLLLMCLPAAHAVTRVQDDQGRQVELTHTPHRVVSLLPSLTETLCVLGECARLVGVDRYSNWPASVQSLPRMGGGIDPNIEAILTVRPDLVLLAGSTRGAERLEALGVKVLRLEPRTTADVRRVLNTLARAFGLDERISVHTWLTIEAGVSQAIAGAPRASLSQRVYFEVSPAPYGASTSSFIGSLLQSFGLVNIIPADMGPFPKINPEFVVRAQPDIVMLSDSSRQNLMQRPGWKGLPAIQHNRLCVFNQAESDILVRAGPRLAEAAQLITSCLQRLAKETP